MMSDVEFEKTRSKSATALRAALNLEAAEYCIWSALSL
jgi:hypothetical protein